MSTYIYEQAIAEAKKLREVAEQNAKNAIIEAITPRVRELIDRELTDSTSANDFSLNESYGDDDDIILEESAILELAKEITESKHQCPHCDEPQGNPHGKCEACGEDMDKAPGDSKSKKKENKQRDSEKEVVEMLNRLISEEEVEDETSTDESYNEEEDMNLEELLNEIKMEIDFGEIEDEDIESALLEIMPTVKMLEDEDEEVDVDMEAPDDEGAKEDSEGEEFDFDLSQLEEPAEGEEGEGEEEEEEPVEEVFSINEAALSRELQRLRNNRSSNSTNGTRKTLNESRYREQLLQEQRNNRQLKGKLDEYRGAIEDLRDQLNEMNLFNAKLLYVNKLLQTKGLDGSQKKTIIESIDNAESLREVKLVYQTLSESVNKKSTGSLNESKIRKLAGSSSRPTRSGGSLLNESTDQVDRWARLAGLK
jgi:hypothetical protein